MDIQTSIDVLEQQLEEIGNLQGESAESSTFVRWKEATKRRIKRVFGKESKHYSNFSSISYTSWVVVMDEYRQRRIDREAYLEALATAKTRLLVMIDDLKERLESDEPTLGFSRDVDMHSLDGLVNVSRRFRECCQYVEPPPSNEREVQDILWIMLRSHYDDLVREETLPKFGVKSYKPDFGIPSIRLLVEVKFIGEPTDASSIQEELLADASGYINDSSNYDSLVVFVYDAVHKLRDSRKFAEDLTSVDGISETIVVPGM